MRVLINTNGCEVSFGPDPSAIFNNGETEIGSLKKVNKIIGAGVNLTD